MPTNPNPADILSKEMKEVDLVECDRWWRGPEFLLQSESSWPTKILNGEHTGFDEMKAPIRLKKESSNLQNKTDLSSASMFVTVAYDEADFPLRLNKYSSWIRLKRVLIWMKRFIGNSSNRAEHRLTGELLSDELKQAEYSWSSSH